MKNHTTNYQNAFIEIAADCPAGKGEIPPVKPSGMTVANLQYKMIGENPYKYTSDDILFECFAIKNNIRPDELQSERERFFSKGQPCLRTSPLTKKYGWGIHCDKEGRVAMYGHETKEYENFCNDKALKILKAMKSAK